ncbi:MAG: hypothetical protein SGCHY_001474 [Lobulomycetales sp.]
MPKKKAISSKTKQTKQTKQKGYQVPSSGLERTVPKLQANKLYRLAFSARNVISDKPCDVVVQVGKAKTKAVSTKPSAKNSLGKGTYDVTVDFIPTGTKNIQFSTAKIGCVIDNIRIKNIGKSAKKDFLAPMGAPKTVTLKPNKYSKMTSAAPLQLTPSSSIYRSVIPLRSGSPSSMLIAYSVFGAMAAITLLTLLCFFWRKRSKEKELEDNLAFKAKDLDPYPQKYPDYEEETFSAAPSDNSPYVAPSRGKVLRSESLHDVEKDWRMFSTFQKADQFDSMADSGPIDGVHRPDMFIVRAPEPAAPTEVTPLPQAFSSKKIAVKKTQRR